jgi:hypothetical protein
MARRCLQMTAAALSILALAVGPGGCSSAEQPGGDGGTPSSDAPVSPADGSAPAGDAAGADGSADAGGPPASCQPSYDSKTLHLAVGGTFNASQEQTLCLRWTAPEDIDVSSFTGTMKPIGHHALLIAQYDSTVPDGVAPCNEADLMDAQKVGKFSLVAGISYESDGKPYTFPAYPVGTASVQVGLKVPKGAQLILDGHFINANPVTKQGCVQLDLEVDKPVAVPLEFQTLLPDEEFALAIPAHGNLDQAYDIPAPARQRIAAVISHQHAGSTHFKLSIKETGMQLYETSDWNDPAPALFQTQTVVVEQGQNFHMECSFENTTDQVRGFPAEMCVGAMYVLPCTFPGACP